MTPSATAYPGSAYAVILKVLNDETARAALFPLVTEDGKRLLNEAGFTTDEQRKGFLQILNLALLGVQQQRDQAGAETMLVMTEMKTGLRRTIGQMGSAFNQAMWMYTVSFYLGVVLILTAIAAAFWGKELVPMVLGGLGTANTLAFFFTKPPERLQSSRASLAQLQCALLAWFTDIWNQNNMITELFETKKLDQDNFQDISERVMTHTESLLNMLQRYCKLVESPGAAPETKRPPKPDKSEAAEA